MLAVLGADALADGDGGVARPRDHARSAALARQPTGLRRSAVTLLALLAAGCGPSSSGEYGAGPHVPGQRIVRERDPTVLGAAGYTTAAELVGLVADCEASQPQFVQPRRPPTERPYGRVFDGFEPPPALGPPPADGRLVWTARDPEQLDPHRGLDPAGEMVAAQLFEPLLAPPPDHGALVPGAAQDYTVSDDGTVYTFELRPSLSWSDGRRLTADDVRASWLRLLAVGGDNPKRELLWPVRGARDHALGGADASAVGVRVVSGRVLEVTLSAPAPTFLLHVADVALAPLPLHVIERHGDAWTDPANIVVNGPYTLAAWSRGVHLDLARNPRYWDRSNVAIAGSRAVLGLDAQAAVDRYTRGEVHWVRELPRRLVPGWVGFGRGDLHLDQRFCTAFMTVRLDHTPLDDRRVRHALSAAIDRRRLVAEASRAGEVAATSLVGDLLARSLGYLPAGGVGHDPDRAAALLTRAGYPLEGALEPLALTINFNRAALQRQLAAWLAHAVADAYPIELAPRELPWTQHLAALRAGDFDLAYLAWCATEPDPVSFLEIFRSGGPHNHGGYVNPVYDGLLDQIAAEPDRRKRNVAMCAAERVLVRDTPVIPLFFHASAYLSRPFVRGLRPRPGAVHLLKYLSLATSD